MRQRRPQGGSGGIMLKGMESLGLSQKDVQFRSKWRRRIKGATG